MADKFVGAVLDQYQILSLLAEGPVARVYWARQTSIDRTVAVKIYYQSRLRRRAVDRFRTEAAAIARLEHINIAPMFGFGDYDGYPYLVTRYFEGGSLANLIQAEGPLPPGNVARIVQQIAGALQYAHGQGVMHRDIKPANILLDTSGTAYLSDFVINSLGGPRAIVPESPTSDSATPQMDVYALGVTTYEMLTAKPPYEAENHAALAERHSSAPVPAVTEANPDIPMVVSAVVGQAMAKQPEERLSSPLEFANNLRQVVDAVGLGQAAPFRTLVAPPARGPGADAGATMPIAEEPTVVASRAAETIQAAGVPGATPSGRRTAEPRQRRAGRGVSPLLLAALGVLAVVLVLVGVGGGILSALSQSGGAPALVVNPTLTLPPTPNELTRTPQIAPQPTQGVAVAPAPQGGETAAPPPAQELSPEFDSFGVPMVLVPAGSFLMGDEQKPDQRPVHEVMLDAFYIDKYEVTNAELRSCVLDDVCVPHQETVAPGIFGYFGTDFYAQFPVIYMSWQNALDYCRWRGARLPTEAEWEKAARWDPATGQTHPYPWGDAFPSPSLANYIDAGRGRPVAVTGTDFPQDVSPVGAYYMGANVKEWVADWYDPDYYDQFASTPAVNPQGPETGEYRVLRGASFRVTTGGLISSTRWFANPLNTDVEFGFRCALTPGS